MRKIIHQSRIRITRCPAAQSVVGCIDIQDELVLASPD